MSDTTGTNTITIDGVAYEASSLSEDARNQVTNLKVTERKIAETEQHLAILRTARTAYANALKAALPTN